MDKKILKEKKEQVIKELQILTLTESQPLNSKKHRGLYKRACKYIGSWREANMQAGLKVRAMRASTIDNKRKSEILERIILLSIMYKKIPSEKFMSKYYLLPTSIHTIETIFKCKWEELVNKLELDLRQELKFFYMDIKDFLKEVNININKIHVKLLINYINNSNCTIPYIYIVKKLNINWQWLNVLKRNNFNINNIQCSEEEILNILAFKTVLLRKEIQSVEINNDILLPNTVQIMQIFNKSISEITLMVEKETKYILEKKV